MPYPTHEVTNQVPPLEGFNLFEADRPLREALQREGAGWAEDRVAAHGARLGGEPLEWGVLANTYTPVLRSHDRCGHRVDEVEYHPAYHDLMRLAIQHELHALPWRQPGPGAHVTRAALFYLQSQVEAGHGCPISMTFSVIPALRMQPEVAAQWEPRILSTEYDPRMRPADEKTGATCGMAMTEKQGGSDVRANTTRAVSIGRGGPGTEYLLTGHKWFCSAPMCDAFLVLAYTDKGLTCFLVPRWLPDGSRNRFFIQRLKDKLGNRSNASSEIELDDTWGLMVGEEGRGVPTIIEMVNHTRMDCIMGSSSGMRMAVAQALHHASHRSAFRKPLIEQPLMRNVLADLCLESEAATTVMMRLARAYDESHQDPTARAFARLATAVMKYWICKRQSAVCGEALECLGGGGFVEESILSRLYREAPCNSIWEGSGNIMCLDVLRAMARSPESVDAFFGEVLSANDGRVTRFAESIREDLGDFGDIETRARRLVERLALVLQASLLSRHSDPAVADAFCASRLDGRRGLVFGTLPANTGFSEIIERSRPVVS